MLEFEITMRSLKKTFSALCGDLGNRIFEQSVARTHLAVTDTILIGETATEGSEDHDLQSRVDATVLLWTLAGNNRAI